MFTEFNHSPSNEQIFFINDLLDKVHHLPSVSEEDKAKAQEIKQAIRKAERELFQLQCILENYIDDELVEKLKEQLDPFSTSGVIFMGAGHFSNYKCMRLHEHLAEALSWVSGRQQMGLMGTDPASEEELKEIDNHLKGFLTKLAEKLGVTNISFENSSKDAE